jgi:glycosyltransferase involved in cell wall biosynthesis
MKVLMICPELPRSDKPGSMAPGARQIRSLQDAGIETEIVDMRGIPKLKYLQVLPRIRRLIREVDLVHAHYGYCGWLALIGRRLAFKRIPIVMSYMGSDLLLAPEKINGDISFFSHVQAKWNIGMASWYSQVIVKSQQMADIVAPAKCHIVSNGIDVTVFQPEDATAACQRVGLDPNKPNVLFPGNPENIGKGYQLACESTKVAEQILGTEIQLVPLWGVKPDDVANFMNGCNAMLMTSFSEGSPNVVKEGLACNLKIVGVPVGDVQEMLSGVQGCYCAGSRDPEEIGTALAEQLRIGGRSNGREVLLQRGLDLPNVAKRIISIYEMALKRS